jgi:hypothetical protein
MPIGYFSMGFNRLESKTPADNYSWYRKERRTMNLFGSLCGRSQALGSLADHMHNSSDWLAASEILAGWRSCSVAAACTLLVSLM